MQRKIRKAMLMAAGYGTRLKPLTDRTPKPLVPVAGRPMIDYALDRLQAYGLAEVVINVSHLKEPLVAYLRTRNDLAFRISEEPEPLETGGGLKQALPLLGDEPFFTINSDIIWLDGLPIVDRRLPILKGETREVGCCRSESAPAEAEGALARLARHWDDATMDVLLLVQSKARAVGYDRGEDHLFIKPGNTIGWDEREAPYIIAGVGILHPRLLQNAPDGKFWVKLLWHEALRRNRLFCLPHRGRWFQTGTIEHVMEAEQQLKVLAARE